MKNQKKDGLQSLTKGHSPQGEERNTSKEKLIEKLVEKIRVRVDKGKNGKLDCCGDSCFD